MTASRSAGPIWGDGFADDGWADVARVARWDHVHPDELLRLFPGLIATAAGAGLLLDLLEQAVAARCRHAPMRGDDVAMLRGEASGSGEDAAMLALDALLAQRRAGRTVPYTAPLALTLAFHAGIHPAYVWDEALPLHEVATAVGWLGVVARGRGALLPRDIAVTLADGIAIGTDATGRPRDQRFGPCGLSPRQWGVIGCAARRRLEGKREIVRLGHLVRPAWIGARGREVAATTARALHRCVLGAITAARAG